MATTRNQEKHFEVESNLGPTFSTKMWRIWTRQFDMIVEFRQLQKVDTADPHCIFWPHINPSCL